MTGDLFPRVHRPCDECPWRVDAEPERFPACRYDALRDTTVQRLGAPIFACHKSPEGGERACAGWLAVEGHRHISVRLACAAGRLDPAALEPGDGWPVLYASYDELAAANGATVGRSTREWMDEVPDAVDLIRLVEPAPRQDPAFAEEHR